MGTSSTSDRVQRLALWDVLDQPRGGGPILSTWEGDGFRPVSWDQWRSEAFEAAGALRQLGVRPATRVACLLGNSFATCRALIGVWIAGGTPVSLPLPARGMSPAHYHGQLLSIVRTVRPDLVLVEAAYEKLLETLPPEVRVHSYESLRGRGSIEPEPPTGDEAAFIQFTSGSTASPRGCVISAAAMAAQVETLGEELDMTDADRGVSWLPLSHDMGLFGALMQAWRWGLELVLSSPQRFLSAPRSWMQDCADLQATLTVAPNFALALATRAAQISPPSRRFPLRSCIIGAERVVWETLERAATVLGPWGLDLRSMTPAYGLAEATLAVSITPWAERPRALSVDREALIEGRLEESPAGTLGSTRVVSAGRALRGTEVSIAAPTAVGPVTITSPSLASSYIGDPESTERTFVNGELRTKDLGFLHRDELFIVGRADDVVCIGGRNIYAAEVEAAMDAVTGVRAGSTVLVEHPSEGAAELVMLAEPASGFTDFSAAAHAVRRLALDVAGVRVDEVVFLAPGTLPKTPSGKVQRFRCAALADSDAGQALARVR